MRRDCDGDVWNRFSQWSGKKWFCLTWTTFGLKWHFLRFGAIDQFWTVVTVSSFPKCRRAIWDFSFSIFTWWKKKYKKMLVNDEQVFDSFSIHWALADVPAYQILGPHCCVRSTWAFKFLHGYSHRCPFLFFEGIFRVDMSWVGSILN